MAGTTFRSRKPSAKLVLCLLPPAKRTRVQPPVRLVERPSLPTWLLLSVVLGSAGVPALAASQDPPVQHYRAVPEISVGDLDGPLALTRVGSLAVVDSLVLVSQPAERVVRVLHAGSGELLHEWGRTGDGPGEMRDLSWMGVVGLSVIIVDRGLRRVTRYSVDGTLVSSERFELPAPAPPFYFGGWIHSTRDGNLIVVGDVLAIEGGELPELNPWRLIDPGGNVLDTLPAMAGGDRSVVLRRERGTNVVRRPLHRGDRVAISVDGARFVRAGDRSGQGLSLAVYHTGDRRTEFLDLGVPPVRVPPDEAARVERNLRRGLEERGLTRGIDPRELDRALAAPPWIPAVDELFVTGEGEIWLREPSFGGRSHLWRVVGPDGTLAATVEVPDGIVLRDRAGDHVWGYSLDPTYGVTSVVRARLEPVEAAGR